LPGIRSESSGGEGNANITVRGIPLATGGSKYLQLMEDGLPVLEYGDLNFANADNFIRYDWSVQRIESIRGGSASTFASDSPGGVINFISNTGEKEGGAVGASFGADYRETRADFAYGGHLSDTIRFHVGGYYRTGEGVRHTGFNGQNGGQIKLNITKEFDGGYLRFFAKHLDDRVSTYLPSAVLVKSSGKFGPVPGYDASTDSTYSQYQTQVNTFDAYGNRVNRDLTDGIHAKVESFGFEFDKDAGNGWHINDKVRNSTVSGGFISPFTDTIGSAPAPAQAYGNGVCALKSAFGATGCDATVVTYATGPKAGQVYTGLAFTNLLFDTKFNDVGLFVNDLKISKDLGPVTAVVGYYTARQKVAIDWTSWQVYAQSVSRDPIPLNITSATGQRIASGGLADSAFLSWSWNLNYDTNSPYVSFSGAVDKFNWDVSARFDHVRARGTLFQACCGTGAGLDYNNDGVIEPFEQGYNFSTTGKGFVSGVDPNGRVNYSASHTEFSLGGSYRVTDDSSVFGRYSNGARFSADRLLQIAGSLNADGSLTSSTKGYDLVKQLELGYKLHRNDYSLYATLFHTKTDETNADLTTGETFLRTYKAYGLELEGNWQLPMGFDVGGNMTYTHAKIDSDAINAAVVGERPRRQANLIWTITPQYRGANFGAGLTFQGSSDYFLSNPNNQANALKQGAYTLINLFGYYNLSDALSLSVNVNNLTDEFVVTEAEEATGAPGSIVRARPLNGRSTMVSLRYAF
jgi:outer membrane receptor protein involved in Fe transport